MKDEPKTLKQYCKEAKKRLKSGFWQNYRQNLNSELERAERDGIAPSKVKEFYAQKVSDNIRKGSDDFESFYIKVKTLLDSEGEVSNAIGRLTDKDYYSTLTYEEQQRYTMSLSEKYLKAVERYRKEKDLNCR